MGRRLLRQAVTRPEFELVRSFPITGADVRRVDLYRIVSAVDPVTTVDLGFPSFTNREFLHIAPITR
jgi:tRNA A37 threonylcarbamoyladenosine biosynthesis protein TsaE